MRHRWGRTAGLLMAGTVAVAGLAGCTRPGAAATSDQSATTQVLAPVSPPVSVPAEEPAAAEAGGVGDAGGGDAPGAGDAAVAASVQAVADAADALIAQAEEAMAGDD